MEMDQNRQFQYCRSQWTYLHNSQHTEREIRGLPFTASNIVGMSNAATVYVNVLCRLFSYTTACSEAFYLKHLQNL